MLIVAGGDVQLPCHLLWGQVEDCPGSFKAIIHSRHQQLYIFQYMRNAFPAFTPLAFAYLTALSQGLSMSQFAMGKLAETGKELCEEREEALAVCKA